ncbi:MAG: NAD-dependent epimerase/dehydratase family protein [Bradyrhizobium sp.]
MFGTNLRKAPRRWSCRAPRPGRALSGSRRAAKCPIPCAGLPLRSAGGHAVPVRRPGRGAGAAGSGRRRERAHAVLIAVPGPWKGAPERRAARWKDVAKSGSTSRLPDGTKSGAQLENERCVSFPSADLAGVSIRMNLANARVIITGGLGLIGSTLARRLVDLGCDVLLIDSMNANFGGNVFNIQAIRDRVRVNISDIRDVRGLHYLLRDCQFLFNLAGQTSHMDSMNAPFEDLEINCMAQLSLLETCRTINPHVRIVFASTRQVYGKPQYLPVDEKHPVGPVDVNGINKIAGESYHILYHANYGIPSTVLRLTNTYGPHMRIKDARQTFMGIWVRNLLERRAIELWGGRQRRDFLYVDDAVEAFLAAATTPATVGKTFNIGGADVISLAELASLMIEQVGGTVERKEFPRERKLIDIGDYFTDDNAFRSVTGWQPDVHLREGVDRTLSFYKMNARHYL